MEGDYLIVSQFWNHYWVVVSVHNILANFSHKVTNQYIVCYWINNHLFMLFLKLYVFSSIEMNQSFHFKRSIS